MNDSYIFVMQTVKGYSLQMRRKLVNNLLQENVLTKKEGEQGKIYLGEGRDAFLDCLRDNEELIKKVEEWEFKKSYKYSLIYTYSENINKKIDDALKKGSLKNYNNLSLNQFEELHEIIKSPSYLSQNDGVDFIKFNIKMEAKDADDMSHKKRYPILVCIYHDMNIIEIRFDSLGVVFGKDKMEYVYGAVAWLKNHLTDTIRSLDLEYIVEEMRKKANNEEGLIIVEQDMRMNDGGTATIGIGKRNSKSLPFIGELKEILETFEEDLKMVPKLKQELQDFLTEKEELSEYPWTIFRFEKENYETKIIRNYRNQGDWLIQHFYSGRLSNIGKERMENVTRYIIEIKENLESDDIKCDPAGGVV